MPFFSVVIPTCERNELLARCLEQLEPGKQQIEGSHPGSTTRSANLDGREHSFSLPAYEVVVTDDGVCSTSEQLIRERYPWARWIGGARKGPAANRNSGAWSARGEWLVFLDDDCIPVSGLLEAYYSAACSGRVSVLEGRTEPCGERLAADFECPVNLTGGNLWSCNFAIRRALFGRLGGFDESLPGPAMEDVEFRWRVQDAGERIEFVPRARVVHPWRRRKSWPFPLIYANSVAYCVQKHPDRRRQFLGAAQCRIILHAIINFARDLAAFRGRGAFRKVILDLASALLVLRQLTSRKLRS
jgi:GT2 family glycosyltransferase